MKIGVFDSGIGGKSVVNAIARALPEHEVVFAMDSEHFPYATKSPQEILGYVIPIFEDLVGKGCKVIVVACNTVSTTLITELRKRVQIPLVAMEPMVKPAAEQTKSKVIAVCATPTTLASERYRWLKETYAKGIKVLEPDCSDWSYLIETNQMDHDKIQQRVDAVLDQGADMLVLGCTHYHWIEEDIKQVVQGRAKVIQPEQPVIEQLRRVLAQLSS